MANHVPEETGPADPPDSRAPARYEQRRALGLLDVDLDLSGVGRLGYVEFVLKLFERLGRVFAGDRGTQFDRGVTAGRKDRSDPRKVK